MESTLVHAARLSQDVLSTNGAAIIRDEILTLADALPQTEATMAGLARRRQGTVVPNYTNGVAAQPNSRGNPIGPRRRAGTRHAAPAGGVHRAGRSPTSTMVLAAKDAQAAAYPRS